MTPLPHMDKHPTPMVTPYRAPAVKPPHLHRRRANEIRWCCPPSTSMLPLSSSTTQTIFPSSPAASTSHPAPQSLRCPSVWWPHYLCRPPPSSTNSSMSKFPMPPTPLPPTSWPPPSWWKVPLRCATIGGQQTSQASSTVPSTGKPTNLTPNSRPNLNFYFKFWRLVNKQKFSRLLWSKTSKLCITWSLFVALHEN